MAGLINLLIMGSWLDTVLASGDADRRVPRLGLGDDPGHIEGLVGNQGSNGRAIDQRRDTHCVVVVARQQAEPHLPPPRVGEGKNLGRRAAPRFAYSLTDSLPFEPCPWRWTLTILPSISASSMAGSSDTALNVLSKTPARPQSRNRRSTVIHGPNPAGRSRHGAPVRAVPNTSSRKSRRSLPVRPGSCLRQDRTVPCETIEGRR
jgi:hypothetical protein